MKSLLRSTFLLQATLSLLVAVFAPPVRAAEPLTVEVYKTISCGCCALWVEHMQKSGFKVRVNDVRDTMPHRQRYGVPDAMASCHTSVVGGYAIEGHVPAADIKRLLRERPKAIGIAVPGMVQGSPGMEQGRGKDPYNVMLFQSGARYSVFARH